MYWQRVPNNNRFVLYSMGTWRQFRGSDVKLTTLQWLKVAIASSACKFNVCAINKLPRSLNINVLLLLLLLIESIVPSRNTGCLRVLSTSVYQLLGTLVNSSFYPLPWLPIFSICFSVFLSSCFLEGSKVGQPLVLLHPLFLTFWSRNFTFKF